MVSELIRMTVTVTDPDLSFLHSIGDHFVTNSICYSYWGRVSREVQTVNWEAGKEGAVETGVKSGVKKAHKPWNRGKNGAQTVN